MNQTLVQTILDKGEVVNDSVLKVDSFLNHCIDPELMRQIGEDFASHFKDRGITKVLTIESGGLVPAYTTALRLGVPMVFAKKAKPSTMKNPLTATVHSYTKNTDYSLVLESRYLEEGDRILFIDDFLANGEAFKGIESLAEQAKASVEGVGICIEKAWQPGHKYILNKGYDLYCLASIASMKDGVITWREEAQQEN